MAVHVAILMPKYVGLILWGRKTVESRLYRTAMPPIGCAEAGERVYVKQSAGPFRAVATIANVDEHHELTPKMVAALAGLYNDRVCGDDTYWQSKRDSRCASFITLTDVQPIDIGPRYAKSMRAWHMVDEKWDVVLDLPVKHGALRNNYLYVPKSSRLAQTDKSLRLVLPDGEAIDTDVTSRGHLRWRGWGRYYEAHKTRPGDRVRLVTEGDRRYRVQFLRHA